MKNYSKIDKLCNAIRDNNNLKVSKLLWKMNEKNVNDIVENGLHLLMFACVYDNSQVLKELLSTPGIDVNINGMYKDGHTPLTIACIKKHSQNLTQLLAVPGIDVNRMAEFSNRYTPLALACSTNNIQAVVQLLAAPGIDVNAKNNNGDTAIMFCRKETLKLMLEDPRVNLDGFDASRQLGFKGRVGHDNLPSYTLIEKSEHSEMISEARRRRVRINDLKKIKSLDIKTDQEITKLAKTKGDQEQQLARTNKKLYDMEQQKGQVSEDMKKRHRYEKRSLEEKFKTEETEEKHHLKSLKEMTNQLNRYLVKLDQLIDHFN